MLSLGRFQDRIVATREVPPRPASFAPIPDALHPSLKAALCGRGITQLYCHQAETFEAARRGENVVLTTGTASGKSLAYLLPVMQAALDDPAARAILLFPTKALAQDQLRGVLALTDEQLVAGVYDGDTPPAERTRLRDRANLILTNPDMLHAALLPHHGRRGFSHLFRNVRYLVVDELHTYRGAFGAHFANLMRRLFRICRHHGSTPQILASSATIANAREHAETLCGRPFRLLDRDGSPSAGKVIHFWQPPLQRDDTRKPVATEMTALVSHLVEKRHRTIAFCRSRKETEIVLKQARDHLANVAGHDESYLLAGYRGGYTPEERRHVERSLSGGKLMAVISTNALELGIDIGALEVVVQGGFPGTRASFWQQLGRAGRRGRVSHAIVILATAPIDQYIAEDPDWLVGQPAEHAVVDTDNLAIQLAHVRAAAAELPLTLDDAALFPDLGEIASVLERAGEVGDVLGSWHWTGGPFPAGEMSLRNIHKDRFKIVNRLTGTTITEMERPQVYREAHPRAVYLHDGVQHLVERLDLVGHVATVVPVEQNFYTQPDVRTSIDVLLAQETRALHQTTAWFGDVRVDDTVVGYKMLEFHNHQNLGYEALREPLRLQVETEAVWIAVPESVLKVLGAERLDALGGMVHALHASARMKTMAEQSDLRATSFHHCDEESGRTVVALVCFDSHPGGLGFAAKAFEHLPRVLADAIALVARCTCRHGCPACVGSWTRDRRLISWALRRLVEEADASPRPAPLQSIARVPWAEVEARRVDVAAGLRAQHVVGADLLERSIRLERRGDQLVLLAESPGLAAWLGGEAVQARLTAALALAIDVPAGWRLTVEVAEPEGGSDPLRTAIRLQRRHDDLRGLPPPTETAASERLAGGYLLEEQSKGTPPLALAFGARKGEE